MTSPPEAPPISVIVVEDEAPLREEVAAYLSEAGLAVRTAANGDAFWQLYEAEAPDAVVLDLGLPEQDGVAIASELHRRAPTIGLIMATARGATEDRILGYETGANVYLVKPVDLGELLAAIRATLRRSGQGTEPAAWRIDLTGWKLADPAGRSIQLTHAETILMDCLSERPGEPVSRYEIAERLGKTVDLPDHRYVDQTVRRLRRKIEATMEVEAPIRSAHAVGYSFIGPIGRV